MPTTVAYATADENCQFEPTTIHRREPGPTEVYIAIKYAGICHSDIHTARQEWGPVNYPLVPGHEIAGIVTQVGSEVTKFSVGDRVGVGVFVDSCGVCQMCEDGKEQFCSGTPGTIWTYGDIGRDGEPTHGGYSQTITVEQDYVCRIPDSLELDVAAPLMCAGITTYSPLKRWGAGPGKRVGIVGLGGLGHIGVQIAVAMGAETIVLSRTLSKQADGAKLGASGYYATEDRDSLKELRGSFDLILSTVSDGIDLNLLLGLVKPEGVVVTVGLPEHPTTFRMSGLVGRQKILAGSNVGGIALTQEMLDFCGEHGVASVIEKISGDKITAAYDKVVASAVRYRFVIDTDTFGPVQAG